MDSVIYLTHFSYLFFLFASVILYHLSPLNYKKTTLLLISLSFYGLINPQFFWVIPLQVFLNLLIIYFVPYSFFIWGFNLFFLGFFKYKFFLSYILEHGVSGFYDPTKWLLPLGISFVSFQAIGLGLDLKRQKSKRPCPFDLANFLLFFPQIVSGPIERSNTLLPQVKVLKDLKAQFKLGTFFLLSGLFRKLVIADNLAPFAKSFSRDPFLYSGLEHWLGGLVYFFQIYNDFYGYILMAKGVALFFGIELSQNFNRPYFSQSIQDFWNRWHITLSHWIRDYLFYPMSFGRFRLPIPLVLLLVFSLSGLWHGAAINFILWGGFHGLLLANENFLEKLNVWEKIPTVMRRIYFWIMISFSWVLFSNSDFANLKIQIHRMVFFWYFPTLREVVNSLNVLMIFAFLAFILLEYFQNKKVYHSRLFFPAMLLLAILTYSLSLPISEPFIYFQF